MKGQLLVGGGALALAAVLATGASQIGGDAGYAGIGPGFLPWLVSGAIALCGVLLMVEAVRPPAPVPALVPPVVVTAEEATPPPTNGDLGSMAWISAGLLLNAALINRLGFIFSCALLFMLAARGFRRSMGQSIGPVRLVRDAAIGLAISAPVYWMFTKGLGLNLPGLTRTGWL